jgi:hypothetical protein
MRSGEEIATAHLTFDLQTEPFKIAPDRRVEIGFQGGTLSKPM